GGAAFDRRVGGRGIRGRRGDRGAVVGRRHVVRGGLAAGDDDGGAQEGGEQDAWCHRMLHRWKGGAAQRLPPKMPPSTPRRICRPTWLPIVRAVCLAMVSIMPWRRLVPNSVSRTTSPKPRSPSSCFAGAGLPFAGASAGASARRAASISAADWRFTGLSYFAPTGLPARTAARSASVIAPILQRGGAISVFSTGIGTPLSCSVDTSASPVPSLPIALATSRSGLETKVSAAVFTAFWSRGV